eukprot:TRINITY_DN6108_c0_g2_i1.p2 TRINITY_DN6108_c0_g2~~TRINITY_DN6108_c0_g2_i1.p2  ORF type:complete len:159 (-),score=31.96 TRINITY_DN6108_c0_g2_i1:254-730(-)
MSTRRRHLVQQKQQEVVQVPEQGQKIVQAVSTQGGNVVEVKYPDGSQSFCLLPTRFNKTLWIRRGGYLIISELEQQGGNKIRGMVESILYDKDIKQLKKMGNNIWPTEFFELDKDTSGTGDNIQQKEDLNNYLHGDWLPAEDSEEEEDEEVDVSQTNN